MSDLKFTNRKYELAKTTSAFALTCASILAVGSAHAQGTAPSASAPASPTVEQVVVTAERRAVNTQTTSISMSVLGTAAIDEQKVVEISDL